MHEALANKRYCMHPHRGKDCEGGIVRAHSVARAHGLNRIAVNGHVVTIRTRQNGPESHSLGVNGASTFTGFCAYHDSETFARMEARPLHPDKEQCFLLAYRAACYELFAKTAVTDMRTHLRRHERGLSLDDQRELHELLIWQERGHATSLTDFETFKLWYDSALIGRELSDFCAAIVRLDSPPDLLCCGTCYPAYDFKGRSLPNDRSGAVPDMLTLHSIDTAGGGAFVFSWLRQFGGVCRSFVESLSEVPVARRADVLVRYAVQTSENIYMNPSWWSSLSLAARSMMLAQHDIGIGTRRTASTLHDDGSELATWQAVGDIEFSC